MKSRRSVSARLPMTIGSWEPMDDFEEWTTQQSEEDNDAEVDDDEYAEDEDEEEDEDDE
jgi:hypothetical protein